MSRKYTETLKKNSNQTTFKQDNQNNKNTNQQYNAWKRQFIFNAIDAP